MRRSLRQNSPGLWPLGVLDPSSGLFLVLYLVLCTFVPGIRARKGAALGPWPIKTGHRVVSLSLPIGLKLLLGPIFPIFWATGDASKIHVFFASLQKAKNRRINGHWSPPGRILDQFSIRRTPPGCMACQTSRKSAGYRLNSASPLSPSMAKNPHRAAPRPRRVGVRSRSAL